MYRTIQIIIENHNTDWKDTQILVNAFLLPEEERLVLEKADEENRQIIKERPEHFMPNRDPTWIPNSDSGKLMIKQYQQLILYGIKNGLPRPENLAKLYQVLQGPNEDPSTFFFLHFLKDFVKLRGNGQI